MALTRVCLQERVARISRPMARVFHYKPYDCFESLCLV